MLKRLLILLFLMLSVLIAQNDSSDIVYLKNGSIIKGKITQFITDSIVTIEIEQNNALSFKMSEIEKFVLGSNEVVANKSSSLQNNNQNIESENLTKEKINWGEMSNKPKSKYYERETYDSKDPALAGILSFLICGLGQYYNGDIGEGLLFQGIDVAGLVLIINGVKTDIDYNNDYTLCYIGYGICCISSILSITDAYSSAKSYNRKSDHNSVPFWSQNIKVEPDKDGLKIYAMYRF